MILLIDNYDSFTYNLYHCLMQAGAALIMVKRNDQITLEEIKALNPRAIVISPGPSTPSQAGVCLELITHFVGKLPILGVCLGHQIIGQSFGCKVVKTMPRHGKIEDIYHLGLGIFKGLPSPFKAVRYHSLIIEDIASDSSLQIIAKTKDGTIMALRHKEYPVFGVQFHPESVASEYGVKLLANFMQAVF